MILDEDGNPIKKEKTGQQRIVEGGKRFKAGWLLAVGALASIALAVTNFQTIYDFIVPPSSAVEVVKFLPKSDHVEVTLKNRGEATALVTGSELMIEDTYTSEFPLIERMRFLNIEKEFQVKLQDDKKQYRLHDFRLQLKSDETVVFAVKFDNENAQWTCFRGKLELELEGNQMLDSQSFESTTGGYQSLPVTWEEKQTQFQTLLNDLRSFSTDPKSSIGDLIKSLERFDSDMKATPSR